MQPSTMSSASTMLSDPAGRHAALHGAALQAERQVRDRTLARPLFFEGISFDAPVTARSRAQPSYNDSECNGHDSLIINRWRRRASTHPDYDDDLNEKERRLIEMQDEELRLMVEQVKAFIPVIARTLGSLGSAALFNAICSALGFQFHLVQLDK